MTNFSTKPPLWFWVVSVIALLWNGMGVIAYLTKAFATDEMISELEPHQQAEFLIEYPVWVVAAFAMAVFCGFLACMGLLFRKKLAYTLFIISAIAAFAQHAYIFINIDVQSYLMPIMVIVVCIFLVLFAKSAVAKHWIS